MRRPHVAYSLTIWSLAALVAGCVLEPLAAPVLPLVGRWARRGAP